MDANTLRQRYLAFFQRHGHVAIGAAPLIPQHDPSVLFTTAGMHPLVPFLLGEPHPAGRRLVNYQKCLRTNDIESVGDPTHLTLFEMLGNWSLGDYWKDDALRLNFELLTEVFGHDPARLHVTCFAGDSDAPRDDQAAAIWRSLGIPKQRISFLSKEDNWWGPAGTTGPCGPDSEVFFDTNPNGPADQTPATHPQRFWELGNNVFMGYNKQSDGQYMPLEQRNVDVGVGLERNLMVLQGVDSAFATDLFIPIIEAIHSLTNSREPLPIRIIADHVRAAVFVLAEGVLPGNTDQPYIVRRLIRRAIRYGRMLGINHSFLPDLADTVIATMMSAYPELGQRRDSIAEALAAEELRFQRTLARGEREFVHAIEQGRSAGLEHLPGSVAFHLYDTYGFPLELTEELAREQGMPVDSIGFQAAYTAHQEQSRQGAAERFRGGLAERNPATTRLHTATHLLQAALRCVLGEHVEQRGSNITTERLRFDFSHPQRLSKEQLTAVETIVNQQIADNLPVHWAEMPLAEAQQRGAIGLFAERYSEIGELVKVYAIGDVSLEVCGGPHVASTSELGHFRILKEEAVAAGIRRIKAVVE
ncbi:MAG: alanine--tRNA ligase [Roseiflexaceae bacterium]|nr:alanine--tRNA ligase [Roseiflexaceae bacterium]